MQDHDSAQDFSLVRGDPLFRLQRRVGLIPRDGLGLVRRALFWSMLGWLPVAAWAAYAGSAWFGGAPEPLLAHFGVHARLLVAVPLLILAEGPASAMLSARIRHFVASGIVTPAARADFDAALRRTARLRDRTLPWVAILAVVVAFASFSTIVLGAHEAEWSQTGPAPGSLGFGGLWYLYVGRSIYLTLVLGWLWRLVLLTDLLRRIARLPLSLVPTHPDRAGGLGFLEPLPSSFAPLALAFSVVMSSRWAHDAVYHDLVLQSLRVEMAVFVAANVILFALPLLAFAGPLARARKQALLDYGALVGQHGRLVHRRWIEGREIGEQPVLDAPELGPVADTAALYDSARSMRTVPLGKASLLPVALAATLPVLAVLSLQVPVVEVLGTLVKALL